MPTKKIYNPNYTKAKTIHEFCVLDIKGEPVQLDIYKNCVCIIVNVASKSPFADNGYKALNRLYDQYEDQGLRILAFPCNQFGLEEPGTNEDILRATAAYNLKFDIFDKVDVNGEEASPLWKFLKSKVSGGKHGNIIKTNFEKFIVKRNGTPVERLAPHLRADEISKVLLPYVTGILPILNK